MLRKLFQTSDPASQPFVISGSGTLGWDQIASNLAEPGDEALVLHTGYFGDSFADCLTAYGVKATQLKAPIGERPQLDEVEKALKEKSYKIITITHTVRYSPPKIPQLTLFRPNNRIRRPEF
jgi:alanine-glyoxylate transaminase/serine-glyoxylate transaminase/serine-pyruvate transaminase